MLPLPVISEVESAIAQAVGEAFHISEILPVGGGCISRNYRVGYGRWACFLKMAENAGRQFAAEADGLRALAQCDALVVPRVIAKGKAGRTDFLVLEWLDLKAAGNEAVLGEAIAALHGITYPRYGWETDNFIGSTPQPNARETDWIGFFWKRRLRPQLQWAAARGGDHLQRLARPLRERLPELFTDYVPVPSLVHGDLWAGNKAYVAGRPCLFDPAVYAGDGETDLAMSELFGGFSAGFYAGYRQVRPLDEGYARRRPLYQLYHILNHYNLFGGGYQGQAEQLLRRLLA